MKQWMKQWILQFYDTLMTVYPDGCISFIAFISRPGCKRPRFVCELCPPLRPAEESQCGTWWNFPSGLWSENITRHSFRASVWKASIIGPLMPPCVKNVYNNRFKTGVGQLWLVGHSRLLNLTNRAKQEQRKCILICTKCVLWCQLKINKVLISFFLFFFFINYLQLM